MKRKISNKEKMRRKMQSQKAKQGYICIGSYESNWMIG